jgi:putative NIF3 family GTP cyclohydrolase 1 type 2
MKGADMSSTLTIQQVIDTILKEVPGGLPADTVDTIKVGDPAQLVTGIVTTFMATWEVIEKAAGLGANLIIPHEPLFFNHRDTVDWLKDDPVYLAKRRLLEDKKMTVWRFHDGWHSVRPDGVLEGLLRLLDWKSYQDPDLPELVHLPSTPLDELTAFLKVRLGAPVVRVVGPDQMVCRKAVVFCGYTWGEMQIEVLNQAAADVVITGETPEWSMIENVRDAAPSGHPRGVIVLGHEVSEEPGMAYLAEWLRPRLPGVPITHISAGYPLRTV